MNELPSDGATTRLHKLNHLIEYCASFTQGCNETQLINEGLRLGNTSKKILEYITILKNLGLITRIAQLYFVDELNYREWAEAKGFRERVYLLKCQETGCESSYGSRLPHCPNCHTQNPLFLNEPTRYTHIAINSIPKQEKETNNEQTT